MNLNVQPVTIMKT